MRNIHPKTLQDLEFPTVLTQIASRCNTELGKEDALTIQPFRHKAELMEVLGQTSEYLASFSNDNRIPNHGFDHINNELGLLKIDNSTLEISGFRKIGGICKTVAIHQKFFKKFKEYYPLLFDKDTRKLKFKSKNKNVEFKKVRSFDACTFVAFGAAQIGIAGEDVIQEFDYSEVYAPLNLNIGHCKISVAALKSLLKKAETNLSKKDK